MPSEDFCDRFEKEKNAQKQILHKWDQHLRQKKKPFNDLVQPAAQMMGQQENN